VEIVSRSLFTPSVANTASSRATPTLLDSLDKSCQVYAHNSLTGLVVDHEGVGVGADLRRGPGGLDKEQVNLRHSKLYELLEVKTTFF
jgi:hypothetical protein